MTGFHVFFVDYFSLNTSNQWNRTTRIVYTSTRYVLFSRGQDTVLGRGVLVWYGMV